MRSTASRNAPLTELLAASGLQTRGMRVAHEQSLWDNAGQVERTYRVIDELGPDGCSRAAIRALSLIDGGVPDRWRR
jgi:hypothetical protein